MSTNSPLVDNYLRRLRAALAGLPADRRQDIIEGVTQHIADARLQLKQDSQEGDDAIRGILGQLGDPDVIAADALDAERGSAAAARPPRSVRDAVWLMCAGAAVSLAAAIADIATRSELRAVIARTRNLIGAATTATFTQAAAVNMAGVVLFLLMARWTGKGSITARTLACVLFGLRTVTVLIGPGELSALSPWPVAVRVLTVLGWLAGLGAIVFLWQKTSTAFIRARFR